MINENAILSPTASAEMVYETGLAAIARFSAALRSSVTKALKQAAIERELARLDTRMLDDLGLARGEIRAVARQAVSLPGEGTLFAEFSRLLTNTVVRPLVNWARRREVYNELMAMDDRMLSDIGIARYEIAEYVGRLGRELEQPLPESLTGMEQDVTAPLRAWNRARLTARQLSELSDRQLVDIGVVRGDIDELAQEVARKAANSNAESIQPKVA
jgi:uncharacterized protein YjiS (DUF1127 family)